MQLVMLFACFLFQIMSRRHHDNIQVAQLAQDRADLQGKLTQLEQMVKRMVVKEEVQEATEAMVEDQVKEDSQHKEKILELLSEIGTDSNQIVAKCENMEPWFWDNCENKVITV